ncbi:MAG: amidohydrolase family protein [Paludibacteraceae bacterium]|nr:amidohydrolase family protein [Paludibacteraceae bacterium]
MIYRANIICTPTPERFKILEHGYVVVNDDGRIQGVYESLPDSFVSTPVTDFGDCLLIPAFCDMHVHAPQYRNLGLALDEELLPWLQKYTFPEEMKFSDIRYAERIYRRFVHELWMQGTMRSAVFATIHPQATDLLAALFEEAGMSAYVGLVAMNRNCPDQLTNTAEDACTYYQDAFQRQTDLVKPILTPRFIPACTPDMLSRIGQLAASSGMPVQSHLSENLSEVEWVQSLEVEASCYGDAYNRYGLFGQTPTLMAHCCYTDGEELRLLRDNGVFVVHCPTSNSNLASGMAPIRHFLNEGVKVALGTDVSAGHYLSMLRVIQYAIQISKLHYAQSRGKVKYLSLSEAFYLATKSGGAFFGKVGSFEPGYMFDALVVDDSYLNYDNYSLEHRIERYIYLGDDRDIRHRFCNGKELKEICYE